MVYASRSVASESRLAAFTCRRQQHVRNTAPFQQLNEDADARGLADARAAADDRHLSGECRRDCPSLVGFQHDLVVFLRLADGRLELVRLEQWYVLPEQLRQALRRQAFSVVQLTA